VRAIIISLLLLNIFNIFLREGVEVVNVQWQTSEHWRRCKLNLVMRREDFWFADKTLPV
jgi:hypothetical protein